jgi:hypothetical protein
VTKHRHLTYSEHKELGAILKPLGDDLVDLSCKIANRNGKNCKCHTILRKINNLFSELKSELEKSLDDCRTDIQNDPRHDEIGHRIVDIYYGPRIDTNRFNFIKYSCEYD